MVNWPFILLALGSIVLVVERTWRLRHEQKNLNQVAMNTALITLAVAATAYGTMYLTQPFYNIGLATWHGLLGPLIGALEVVVLTLRYEQVPRSAVRAALVRSGLVTVVLFVTWPLGFATAGPIGDLAKVSPLNLPVLVHIAVFHLYIIWGLLQLAVLTFSRVRSEFSRRPISALALMLVGLGCAGFIWVNVVLGASVLMGVRQDVEAVRAPTAAFLGLCVGGAALLGFGERLWTAAMARYRLWQLKRLWELAVELSPTEIQRRLQLPPTARMQRAYIEISDALSTLRIQTDRELEVDEVAAALIRGETTMDRSAPTVSHALPARKTRLEDLMMIHALADACRRAPKPLARATRN